MPVVGRVKPRADIRRTNPLLAGWTLHQWPYLWLNRHRGATFTDWPTIPEPLPDVRDFIRPFKWRCRLIARYAWAIPTPEALATIAKYGPVVEIGAGTGYWAWLLRRDYHVDIVTYDAHPPGPGNPFRHRRAFVPVLPGGPREARRHSDRALFLCWPPYAEDMAMRCLQYYRGPTLCYVGEGEGGCNATDAFFGHLAAKWTLVEEVTLPQWDGIHDGLYVYARKRPR